MQPNCDACPLNGGTRVPPYGPEKCNIAFIGEAPGWTEVRDGKPFVGQSGKLLRAAIKACGHDHENIYYTNVCKCKPPKGAPSAKAIACCNVTLESELHERGVKYVAALGNIALKGLGIAAGKITYEHGRTRVWNDFIVVMPMLHPASLLYDPNKWPEFAEDIEAFFKGGEHLWRHIPGPAFDNYYVVRHPDDAVRFLGWLGKQPFVYFDLETSSLAVLGTRILCISFSCGPDHAVVFTEDMFNDEQVGEAFCDIVANSPLKWGGHNAQFDVIRILMHKWNARIEISEDSMIQHYCLDERNKGHGLKELAMKHLRVPDWEADIKQWLTKPATKSYALIPENVLYSYNARDAVYGFRLHQLFRPQIAAEADLEKLYTELLIPTTNALVDLTAHGTRVDEELIYDLQDEAEDALLDCEEEMQNMVGDSDFNPRSPKQVAHWLYDVMHAPPFSRTKPVPIIDQADAVAVPYGRSDYTTAADQLERLVYWKYDCAPFAKLMLSYRKNHQLVNTYLKTFIPESDGRIHPSYLLWSAVTGRLASSKPNVLNLTRKGPLRSVIVPEEGNVLLAADYKAAELRVMGALAKSESLLDMFRNNIDPHNHVGENIYGKSYDPDKYRVAVKGVNFGVAYGEGIPSIAEALSCTNARARQIRELVIQLLDVGPWMQQLYTEAKTQGYVSTPTGRRRRFPLILPSNWRQIQRFAVNSPVQSTSSDICLLAMVETNKWIHDMGGALLFPVHDSILVEVPKERMIECAHRLVKTMLEAPDKVFEPGTFPAAVDLAAGYTYAKSDMKEFTLEEEK